MFHRVEFAATIHGYSGSCTFIIEIDQSSSGLRTIRLTCSGPCSLKSLIIVWGNLWHEHRIGVAPSSPLVENMNLPNDFSSGNLPLSPQYRTASIELSMLVRLRPQRFRLPGPRCDQCRNSASNGSVLYRESSGLSSIPQRSAGLWSR